MRSTSSPLAVSITIGRAVVAAAQPAQDRQAVFARHHQVEHQHVEALAQPDAVHRLGVFRDVDIEAVVAEVASQQVAQALVVVDDQDFVGRVACHGNGGLDRRRASYGPGARRRRTCFTNCYRLYRARRTGSPKIAGCDRGVGLRWRHDASSPASGLRSAGGAGVSASRRTLALRRAGRRPASACALTPEQRQQMWQQMTPGAARSLSRRPARPKSGSVPGRGSRRSSGARCGRRSHPNSAN